MADGPRVSPLGDHTTRKDDKEEESSGGETTWTNTVATLWQSGYTAQNRLGTPRLPNDVDIDDE